MKAETLIETIEATGREVRSYSGRGMYGRRCVGVSLGRGDYGSALPEEGQKRDSLGLGEIVYWPSVAWPEGREG
jgi:hypothetical protein